LGLATNGLPVRLAVTPSEAHDNRLASKLLSRRKVGSILLADRGYDADWIGELTISHRYGLPRPLDIVANSNQEMVEAR
jgi:transposase